MMMMLLTSIKMKAEKKEQLTKLQNYKETEKTKKKLIFESHNKTLYKKNGLDINCANAHKKAQCNLFLQTWDCCVCPERAGGRVTTVLVWLVLATDG